MTVLGIGISYGVATLFAMFSGMPIAFALGAGIDLTSVWRTGLLGVGLGLLGALLLTRVLTSLLFGVGSTDLVTFFGVSALLIVVALLACYIPARRAARVDPLVALRQE